MLSKYTHWVAEVHTSEVHIIVQFIVIIISESQNILWTRTTESLHLLGTVQFLAHMSIASLHHSYNRDLHNELYTFFQRCFFHQTQDVSCQTCKFMRLIHFAITWELLLYCRLRLFLTRNTFFFLKIRKKYLTYICLYKRST